ncbi:phage tail tape measure protein, partial [Methylobacterium iners]
MANLDVALRLRLINGIKPGAQDAKRDLEALGRSARALNGVRGGATLARDLSAVAAAGTKADASLRRMGAERAGIAATGAVTARLGTELTGTAVAATKARTGLQQLGRERASVAGLDAVTRALAHDLDRAAAAGRRLSQATGSLRDQRVSGAAGAMRSLARDTDRAATATARLAREQGRLRAGRAGSMGGEEASSRRRRSGRDLNDELQRPRTEAPAAEGDGALVALGRRVLPVVGGAYAGRAAVRGTIGEAISFEKAWSEVIKKVNDAPSPAAMEELQRTVSKTAIELGVPRERLAEMTAEAGAAGIKFSELERYVRLAAKASVGWDMVPRDASQKLAEIKSAGQYTIAEMDALADKINALGDNSAAKEADIVEMVQRSAAPAKGAGVNIDTTLAAVTALRSGGMQAEVASRFFNAFTTKLATAEGTGKGAKKIADAFEMLGLSVAKVSAGMKRDAAGTMMDVLDRLGKHAEPAKVANEIMGGEWGDEFSRFSQSLPEFRKQLDFLRNPQNFSGSLGRNLNVQLATTANHLERLKALSSDVGDRMGRWALPGINETIESVIRQMDELERRKALRDATNDPEGKGDQTGRFVTAAKEAVQNARDWAVNKALDITIAPLPTIDPARAASRRNLTAAADADEAARKSLAEAADLEARAKTTKDKAISGPLLEHAKRAREAAAAREAEGRELRRIAGPAAARDMTNVEFGEAAARKSIETSRRIKAIEAALANDSRPNVRLPDTGITSRQGAQAELVELQERMKAMTAGPDIAGPLPRPNFDASGPAGLADLRIGRAPGKATSFPVGHRDEVAVPKPDRFSLDAGSGARPGMEKAMTALAERLRAERAPIIIPPSAGKSFDVSGPVAPLGAPQLPASGGPGAFPLAADLAKARFDPQPMIIGMQQVQEEAKRLRTGLSQDLSEPARQSMATYVTALSAGTAAAVAAVTAAVAQMKSA